MKLYLSACLIFLTFVSGLAYETKENAAATPDSERKVNRLNDRVDKLLKPQPTTESCKKAEKLALQAADMAERLKYNTGMVRSYEQLILIYGALDYKIKYYRYYSKHD